MVINRVAGYSLSGLTTPRRSAILAPRCDKSEVLFFQQQALLAPLGWFFFWDFIWLPSPKSISMEFAGLSRKAIVPHSMRVRKVLLEFCADGLFRKRFR